MSETLEKPKDDQSVINIKNDEDFEKQVQKKYREEVEHLSKPNWITTQFVQKPFIVLTICMIFFMICLVITIFAGLFSLSSSGDRDYLIWSHETVKIYDMKEEAVSIFQDNMSENQMPLQTYKMFNWQTSLIIDCDEDNDSCDNVLTPDIIEYLYKIEQQIKQLKNYSKYCLATIDSTNCIDEGLVSITPLFDSPSNINNSAIQNVLNDDILNSDDNFNSYNVLFHKQFSSSYKKSKLIRSVFQFASPIQIDGKTYKDQYDNEDEQNEHFLEFAYDIEKLTEDSPPPSGFRVIPYSREWRSDVNDKQISADFVWSTASIIFVWFYLTIHLRSLFLSSFGMFIIIISFPISLVIFKGIFQVKYFSSLHILAVFIILGIAADDIFVFIDAWRQAKIDDQIGGNHMKMMAFTFRRASRAMLATSSTTAAAFFATGFSTLMPISSFGIFAGILVPVNYMLVIFFFSSVVVIHDKYIDNKCCVFSKCFNKKQKNEDENQQNQEQQQEQEQQKEKEKEPMIVRFFDTHFNTFIYKYKIFILIAITIWICIATWRTALMTPISEPEEFLPDDFKTQVAQRYLSDDFGRSAAVESSGGIEVSFFWGIKDISKDGVGSWESDNRGTIVWDNSFNIARTESQNYLYNFCLEAKDHALVLDEQVECFIVDFRQWLLDNSQVFPQPENQFLSKLTEFTQSAEGIGFYTDNQIGIIKGKLRFIQVFIKAKAQRGLAASDMEPIYEDWQEFKDQENKKSPSGMKNGYQTAGFAWVWMQSERAFVSNAIQGMLISLLFAWIVLMLTTQNIIMSLFSVLCISGIVVSVVSIMQLQGWELGISESITIVILIGLSVDYVVHLANHYVESVYPDRYRKMRISLKEIGISIVSGAITTLGSGFFLFFAVMVIFNKFALLIVCTILFSLLFALFYFSALIHLWGPEGETGNYYVFFKKLYLKHKGIKSQQNSSQDNIAKQQSDSSVVQNNNTAQKFQQSPRSN